MIQKKHLLISQLGIILDSTYCQAAAVCCTVTLAKCPSQLTE